MLIGLIADVHSNAVALRAVLSVFDSLGVEKTLHAGDLIGYNPYPNETIELFIENRISSILGNHDRALITGDTSGFNPYAEAAIKWTRNEVSKENLNYITKLKNMESLYINKTKIVILHGSTRDVDEYVYPENVLPEFLSEANADVLVLGHTHIQFKMDYPEGIIVNPGSVGQPRDGNPDAGFAIFDAGSRKVKLERTSYDFEEVIEDMLLAHLPEKLAFRLRFGR